MGSRVSTDARTCTAPTCLNMFFADEEATKEAAPAAPVEENAVIAEALKDAEKRRAEEAELDAPSMEEEVEMLVQKELGKTKRMSNLRNGAGVEYAPWMGISEV